MCHEFYLFYKLYIVRKFPKSIDISSYKIRTFNINFLVSNLITELIIVKTITIHAFSYYKIKT